MVAEESGRILQPGWVQGHWLFSDLGFSSLLSKWGDVSADWDLLIQWSWKFIWGLLREHITWLWVVLWGESHDGVEIHPQRLWYQTHLVWNPAPTPSPHWLWLPGKASACSLQNEGVLKANPALMLEGEDKIPVRCLVCGWSSLMSNVSHRWLHVYEDTPERNRISRKCRRTHPDPEFWVWRRLSSVSQDVFIWLKIL